MQHNPVGWFEIYVQDMHRAQAFYEAVFQIQLAPLPFEGAELLAFPMPARETYAHTPGATGALIRLPGCPSGGSGTLVYFSCEDCAVELERALKYGGQLHRGKVSIGPYGFIALVVDSEGNLIGLHSMQ